MKIHCAHDELIDPKSLKQHPKNRNKHSKEQIDRLCKILEYQGWRYPIKVSKRSGLITSGHGRLMAALKMGLTEVPVCYQDYDSDEQEYADLQADNAIASWSELDLSGINLDIQDLGPDFDIDLLGIKNFTIDVAEKEGEDEIPEKVEAITKPGDYYALGTHKLLCGDSTDIAQVERLMNGEKADMVFTDPPYGLADKWSGGTWATNSMYADAKKWDQPLDQTDIDWIITLAPEIIIWGGNYYVMPPSRCWLSWTKSQQMETMADFELAWTNLDKVAKSWVGARNADGKRSHPTQKPVALMEWGLGFSKGKNVLDLFGGSGSTLIACEKTKRKCFMMELDPHYCDVIVARWEKYTGLKAELIREDTVSNG